MTRGEVWKKLFREKGWLQGELMVPPAKPLALQVFCGEEDFTVYSDGRITSYSNVHDSCKARDWNEFIVLEATEYQNFYLWEDIVRVHLFSNHRTSA